MRDILKAIYFLVSIIIFCPIAKADEQLKIGFILPLTGQWAEFGEAQKNALELARERNPSLFENVVFIYEDCQYVSKNVVTAFHKLRTLDKVDFFYVWGAEPGIVASTLAEQFQVPMLLSAQLSKNQKESKFLLRTINYAEQYSEKLVEYFRSRDIKNIGIIKSELSFYNDRINGIKELLSPNENLEVFFELNPEEADFKNIVASLKTKKFDVLGLYLTPPQIINFYRNSREQKLKASTFGSTPFESKRLLALTNGAMLGSFYEHNDTSEEFHKQYLERFKKDDQIAWAANAFDVANLIGEVLSKEPTIPDGMQVLDSLRQVSARQGAGGEYRVEYQRGIGHYFRYSIVIKGISEQGFDVVFR